ncbi:MAG: chromosomal replication initiator protein DnaA [Nitrospinae bacterium]|nr:chromosomal replication initiator protein DnaA [Nitrospinota bacterium]
MKSFWNNCKEEFKKRVNKSHYEIWLEPTSVVSLSDKSVTISVPSSYHADRINRDYLNIVMEIVKTVSKKDIEDVRFVVDNTKEVSLPPAENTDANSSKKGEKGGMNTVSFTGLNPKYTFDNFVVGPCNQFAHAASKAVAEGHVNYNPLFIYGGVGLGKTHLIQATGNFLAGGNKKRLLYVTSEAFVNDLITSLQHNEMNRFREKYRKLDVLFVDDVHFIAGKERSQEEFFHTFNTLFESHKQIILSSDKYPREIPKLEERLKSRFEWGLIADIQPPELETRIAILKQKGEENGVILPQNVAEFIANKVKSNVRELEGCLSRIIAVSSLKGREISIQLAEEAFKDIFKTREKVIGINDIQRAIAEYFNIKISDLKSKKRERNIAYPRQVAMYLCKELTELSLEDIGKGFGGKDHSTVIHSQRKIERLIKENNEISTTIKQIKRVMEL